MPKNCCVYKCYSTSDKNKDLSFHAFPSGEKLRKAWGDRIRREDFEPSVNSYVCSRHFQDSDFNKSGSDRPTEFQRKKLKRGSIPSNNLRGHEGDEKIPKRRSITSSKARSVDEPSGSQDLESDPIHMKMEDMTSHVPKSETDSPKILVSSLQEQLSIAEKK